MRVLTAARDLDGGVLAPGDLTAIDLPAPAVPDGALPSGARVAGRVLASPVRRGEPLTDVRLLGPGLLAAHGPQTGGHSDPCRRPGSRPAAHPR